MKGEQRPKEYCDVHTLSRYLDMTPRRVQQLVTRGIIPRGKRGQYEIPLSIHAYIEHLHELLYGFSGMFWTRGKASCRKTRCESILKGTGKEAGAAQLLFFETENTDGKNNAFVSL